MRRQTSTSDASIEAEDEGGDLPLHAEPAAPDQPPPAADAAASPAAEPEPVVETEAAASAAPEPGHPAETAESTEGAEGEAAVIEPVTDLGVEPVVAAESVETRAARLSGFDEPVAPPRAFLKGAVFGLVVLIPLTALGTYGLGRLGLGDPLASYYTVIAFVAVFAGLPAIITAGGIGRAAASALVKPGPRGGPGAAIRTGAYLTAVTEIGLVLLSVVPLGAVPADLDDWALIAAVGAVTGVLGGLALGVWVRYAPRRL